MHGKDGLPLPVGSENPTRACFPFLLAVAQKERGDEVAISLAAEGVVLIR